MPLFLYTRVLIAFQFNCGDDPRDEWRRIHATTTNIWGDGSFVEFVVVVVVVVVLIVSQSSSAYFKCSLVDLGS